MEYFIRNIDIIGATKAISESINQFARAKDIRIGFSSALKERVICIDDEKYERVLLNLLSNAIKYTPNGKSISIKVSSQNGKVVIKVKDEGVGIPKISSI